MRPDLAVVLVLLGAAIALFAINRPRMDAVALIMLTVLPFTGAITMDEALAGFSDSNIVLIAAMFVIGDGLVRTGVARRLGDWLIAKAGSKEVRLLVLLNAYFALVIGFAQIYDKKAGIGTVVALMLPYAILMTVLWMFLFAAWYVLGLPWGL
jgi:di/tricarboxylate transporter